MTTYIKLEGKKYEIVIDDTIGKILVYRYGEYWRDLTGDKLFLAMAHEIEALKGKVPKVNILCETKEDGIIGTTFLDVVRVRKEDDDSITAVTNHWPK